MSNTFSYLRLSAIAAFASLFAASASAQCGTVYADDSLQIIFQQGQQLYSCNGLFYATYEYDGNARVYYAPQSQVLWSSETADLGLSEYVFQTASANSGSMTMGDDGNLVVYTGGGQPEFSTNTQGTDCGSSNAFVTDVAKEQLAQTAESEQPEFAAALRSNACVLFNIVAQETGTNIEDIGAPVAGPGALKGRSVINEYKFIAPIPAECAWCDPPYIVNVAVASARLQKTWYYNGVTVSNSGGGDPDKATLKGECSSWGLAMGYSWLEPQGSASADSFAEYNGNGKGAHYSSRVAQIQWKFPLLGGIVSNLNVLPLWQQELYIKGKADGTLECRGGNTCSTAPLP